jgi:hypothetical protein
MRRLSAISARCAAIQSRAFPTKMPLPVAGSHFVYGARQFVRRLNELGIAHRYEEFPDNHTSVDYWMDESLPFLAKALSA